MSDTVVKVENVSKIYDLGLVGTGTLSKDINRFWAKMMGRPDPYAKIAELNDRTKRTSSGTVYALKDIDFEVKKGEVLGVVGKNGAGKSTLLKIMSQITSPSSGSIKIKGRVASLLEVGTGMHPEMTARQNIYLNGSVMGMTHTEITKKLDGIIDFAGIDKYVDTPIKRFSSGMQVRLGFAVAAFLEPEILIVDEVLAVGDAEFQKKAVGKMKDVSSGEGRTVLFVSHNMSSVKSLCKNGILLKNGQLTDSGPIDSIINLYYSDHTVTQINEPLNENCSRSGNGLLKFTQVSIRNASGEEVSYVESGQDFAIELQFETRRNEAFKALHFSINIKNEHDFSIAHMSNSISDGEELNGLIYPQKGKAVCHVKELNLQPGTYYLEIYCASYREPLDWVTRSVKLTVESGNYYRTGLLPPHGVALIKNNWTYKIHP